MIFVSKNGAVCHGVQTHFESSPLAMFTKKFLGAFSRFMCPKTKLFAVKFRRILDVVRIQGLQKDFWAHFHHFCVQKRSSLPWNSDGFGKFFPCKPQKRYGRILSIFASKNGAACCSVETHFGSFRFARFMKKVLGALSRFMCPKTELFAAKLRRILDVFSVQASWRK